MVGTCWIDLTDMSQWRGHMTGIQRVVYNLADDYDKNKAARYFIFDSTTGFSEIAFETIRQKFSGVPDEPVKKRIKIPLSRTARRVARYTKQNLAHTAKQAYRVSPALIQKTVRDKYIAYKTDRSPEIIPNVKHPFKSGDVIFIPGASWNRASIIGNLGVIKEQTGIKIAHVVYDLIPELFPQFFGQGFGDVYIKHIFNAFSISDHLLAISENTKRDTVAFQQKMLLPQVPVDIFRLGDNPSYDAADASPDDRIQAGGYVLAVGTFEIRKNYLMLYYVWKKAAEEGRPLPKMVIVGQPGWLSSDSSYLMHFDPAVRDSFVVMHNVNDKSLAWLYQNCMFTVYPSWYEGWGLPIAESLNYGKLCLTSNTSSMTEIGGDLLEYFNPYDVNRCLDLIDMYANQPKKLAAAEAKIVKGYTKQQWGRAYKDCRKVTDRLLTER